MQIYKFNSILKPILWGGDRLVTFKGLPPRDEAIGESWELSAMPGRESVVTVGDDKGMTLSQLVHRYGADLVGENVSRRYGDQFPLLIKLIDARRDLSVQVHPDEAMAHRLHGCSGKTEMWYILEADEGAVIRTGFSRSITAEEFDRRLAEGTILDIINETPSKPGDTFYIPAGQIHTIGAGNLLLEIQQSSDITYRVWDFNRRDAAGNLRELHINEAREALDFNAHDGYVDYMAAPGNGITPLVKCREFEVGRLSIDEGYSLAMPRPHSFVVLMCVEGMLSLHVDGMSDATLSRGETALVPAVAEGIEMTGHAQILLATVPTIDD